MAATIFACLARSSTATKGRFTVALSGGATPRRLYVLLGTEYREKVSWDKVDIFWADERCVPRNHEESNFKAAYDHMLSNLPVPGTRMHFIECEQDPELGALKYEAELKKCFGTKGVPVFDLVILGVGEDGHTASLFPGSKALAEKERLAMAVCGGEPETWRVSLTLPLINNAAHVLFLASGPSKARVVHDILENPKKKKQYPAGLVSPLSGALTWLLDREAAGRLER